MGYSDHQDAGWLFIFTFLQAFLLNIENMFIVQKAIIKVQETDVCTHSAEVKCVSLIQVLLFFGDLDSKSESQFNEKTNIEPVGWVDNVQDLFL